MDILVKYAKLLVNYCLEIKEGEKLYISSTTLAEPLVREVYREALSKGAHVEIDLAMRGMNRIFYEQANDDQLAYVPTLRQEAMKNFDAYLAIRAPFNLKEDQSVDASKRSTRSKALKSLSELYFERTANKSLKRSLCQYPTQASAQEADMSLEEYQQFVFNACNLYDDNPEAAWLERRASQQKIVDFLNQKDKIRYVCEGTDITFSVKDRIWINSDGQTNMPSGEVFTGPVEDSVNGTVYFSYPAIFMGKEVQGMTLHVKDGKVEEWSANRGKDILDEVFKVDGARYFGEVAIGTNYNIQRATKNILFDEKIGGSIHLAVGQAYQQCGGINQSSVHWDMITDMKDGGEIYADDEMIYKNGAFIIN